MMTPLPDPSDCPNLLLAVEVIVTTESGKRIKGDVLFYAFGRTGNTDGLGLEALGIPTEADHVTDYCRRVGRARVSPAEWEYYMAFGMFRLVAIIQGIMARALQGNASNRNAIETGRQARPLAEQAWSQVEKLTARG